MTKAGVAGRSAPRLRRAVDPDGAEPTAFRIGNDLATCGGAVDPWILPELAGITPAHDQQRRQKPQNSPTSSTRCAWSSSAGILAAKDAASGAIAKNHAETIAAARDLSKAAGEARREAWRYFGGFWVWLASVGAGGAVLGLLAAFLIMGRGDAREFGQYPQVYCTTAGGQVVTNPEGRRFCAIWIDRLSQSGG